MVFSHELANPLERILPVELDDGIAMVGPVLGRRPLQDAGLVGFGVASDWAGAGRRGEGKAMVMWRRIGKMVGMERGNGIGPGERLLLLVLPLWLLLLLLL